MYKKLILLIVALLSMLSLPAQAWRNDEITMLVIPRETIPLQIGQDISRRYPALLVSYQMVRGELKIHAWNGDNWVFVPVEDYTNGTFFANRPKRAIIVENEKLRAPDVLTPSRLWCESATRLTSTDPRVMIHLLGLSFDFPFRHWDQFAKRYGYELEKINPTLKNVSWWHLQGDVLMEKRANRDFIIDLNKWQYLETIPAPVVQPVMIEKPAPMVPAATAVDITAKPAVKPIKPTPKPVEPVTTPEPTPKTPAIEVPVATEPAVTEPAAAEMPFEVEPAVSPSVVEKIVEAAPLIEETAAPEIPAETAAVTLDAFSADEVPAAEIIIPAEPKKAWWKIF